MNFNGMESKSLSPKKRNPCIHLTISKKINNHFFSSFRKTISRPQKGFSLVEMVTSLFLISILLGMASVSFLHLSPKYKLKRAVWEINSSMNYARYKAVFAGTKTRICFGTHSYSVEKYDQSKNEWNRNHHNILDGVTIQANNHPTFHPRGTVSHLASIIISNSWGKYKITLAISGRIKVAPL